MAASDPPLRFVGDKLEACGYGVVDDNNKFPTKLQFTTLMGVEIAKCGDNDQVICTQWTNKVNNICGGDSGNIILF